MLLVFGSIVFVQILRTADRFSTFKSLFDWLDLITIIRSVCDLVGMNVVFSHASSFFTDGAKQMTFDMAFIFIFSLNLQS